MARIKSYVQDTNVTDQDRILGTSYEGVLNNKPIYKTRNYKVTDLARYFSQNFDVDGVNYNLSLISETVTANTFAIATANQSLTVLTNDVIAQATFQTNLAAIFGTVDDQGNLITLSQSFADQILQTTSSARYATAVFATGLASSFGTYDTETGELTGISQAFADSVITTTASNRFAESSSVTSLESTVGNIPRIFSQDEPPPLDSPIGSIWFDTNDGNKRYVLVGGDPNFWQENRDTEFTQFKATAEEELITLATDTSATAQKITNLNAVLEILDENGDLIPLNQAEYFNTITTYVDENSATASSLTELTATVEDNTASITDNETAIVSKPNVYRQTTAPTGEIPLKSVWYDTDDNNKPYVYESTGWVEARDGKVTELETYALAQKTLEADANGIITGITIKSENSGDAAPPISDITFKTNTFNIVDQSNNQKLALDASGNLTINGGGTFTGNLQAAGGTFSGSLRVGTTDTPVLNVVSGAEAGATATQPGDNITSLNNNADFQSGTQVNQADKTDGTVAGWNVDSNYIWSGTKQTSNAFAASGITLANTVSGGAIRAKNFRIDTDGSAFFKGDISGSNGNFSGTLTGANITGVTGTFSSILDIGQVRIAGDDIRITGSTTSSALGFYNTGGSRQAGIFASNLTGYANLNMFAQGNVLITSENATNLGSLIQLTGGSSVYMRAGSNVLELTSSQLLYNGVSIGTVATETDPTVPSHVKSISTTNISNWNTAYTFSQSGGTVSGNLYASDFILTSDVNLKENIEDYVPQPINIQYKNYSFIGNSDKRVGVIAQELEESHPEFIRINGRGDKSVSYIDLLVAKVAELEARIKQLEDGSTG